MSTHPNVILLAVLTPDDLARKTYRALCAEYAGGEDSDNDFKIGSRSYHHEVMEGDYHESWQISAPEGSIIVFDLVTYGYGEFVTWQALREQYIALSEWATSVCDRYKCKFDIRVTANYW